MGFPVADIDFLVDKLNALGFKSTRQPYRNVIHISSKSTPDFLDYIGPCPTACYSYKWELKS
jgi:hypothetical protein